MPGKETVKSVCKACGVLLQGVGMVLCAACPGPGHIAGGVLIGLGAMADKMVKN